WDDGFLVPTAVANHPKCDLGVALELFWLAEAMCWFTGEVEAMDYNRDWATFCELITNRILTGHYQKGETSFTPGLGVAWIWRYRKQGVPEVLFGAIEGTTV